MIGRKETFERFLDQGIRDAVDGFREYERMMDELIRKIEEKQYTRELVKELEAEYNAKRG